MTDEPTVADHAQLREVIAELRSICTQLGALDVPVIASKADSRATRIADKAYAQAQSDFQACLEQVAPVLNEQADSIEQWLSTTEAIQGDASKKSNKLGKDLKEIPTPKPNGSESPTKIAGGTVNPDGTVSL